MDKNLPVLVDVFERFPVPGEGRWFAGSKGLFDVKADELDFVVVDGADFVLGRGFGFEQVFFDLGPLFLGEDGDGLLDFLTGELGGKGEGRGQCEGG